jgi:hypothetical protein
MVNNQEWVAIGLLANAQRLNNEQTPAFHAGMLRG